jgi:hypothetical protein
MYNQLIMELDFSVELDEVIPAKRRQSRDVFTASAQLAAGLFNGGNLV